MSRVWGLGFSRVKGQFFRVWALRVCCSFLNLEINDL